MIETRALSFSYRKGKETILSDINVEFPTGLSVILGPNGAGKSTFTKCMLNMLKYRGDIWFQGENIKTMPSGRLIEQVSYLPQMDGEVSSLTVFEMVLLGRLPVLRRSISKQDKMAVMQTLELLGLMPIAAKKLCQLSGGQQKLVYIAQTIVRKPKLIILDEPTNSLDLQKQLELFEILKDLTVSQGISVITVMHDLSLASRYADYGVVLCSGGTLYSAGEIGSLITSKMLLDVYGVKAKVTKDSNCKPLLSFVGSVRSAVEAVALNDVR